MKHTTVWAAAAFVTFSAHASPAKLSYPVTKTTLPNGIRVLIAEKHDLPIVSYQTWFAVGSSSELNPSEHGLAHLFEHLMFSGTKKYPKSDFDHFIESLGGSTNAATYRDATQYYVNIRSDQIEKIIDMDSDRLLNLLLEPESVKREKKIVLEERRLRLENSVEGRLDELSWSLLVPTGPYGHPIIGSRESVSDANIEALRTWWRQNYHGGNLLITVAGDVKPAHILKVIKEKYGALPGPPKTPKPAIPAMLKPAVREATLPWDSVVVTLHFSYPTVPVGHPDTYALDLLSEILHESRASRLYSTFFRDYPIAQGLTGNHASYRGMGEFSSLIILRPGITKEDAVPLYLKTLDDMRREGPKPEELARVRRKLFMTFDHSARVIDQAALYLSLNELFLGDYRRWVTDFDAYEKVTPKDILAVMNKYIMPDNAVLVSVKPKRTLQ